MAWTFWLRDACDCPLYFNNSDKKRSRSYFNLVSILHYLSTRFHLQAIKINMTKYNFINQNWKNDVIESFQWRPSKCDTVLKCDDGQVYLSMISLAVASRFWRNIFSDLVELSFVLDLAVHLVFFCVYGSRRSFWDTFTTRTFILEQSFVHKS